MTRSVLALPLISTFTLLTAITPAQNNQTTPREPPPPSSIQLMGRVVLADGVAPPERLEVTLICDGRHLRRTRTDSEGRFSLEVSNRPTGAMSSGELAGPLDSTAPWPGPEAGPSGAPPVSTGIFPTVGAGRVDMTSCQLRADAIEGHRPASLPLGIRHALRSPDVGVIILPKTTEGAGADPTVSVNTLAASKEAREALEKAREHVSGDKPDFGKARQELEKALKESPDFAVAWGMLAQIRLRENKTKEAREAFEKAIASDETYDLAYLELARLDARAKDWEACARSTSKLIELNPNVAEGYYLDGAAHYYLGDVASATESLAALETRPTADSFPRGYFMHGMILARQDRIPEAAAKFEAFLRAALADSTLADVRTQVDGQLNVWAEAGIIVRETPEVP